GRPSASLPVEAPCAAGSGALLPTRNGTSSGERSPSRGRAAISPLRGGTPCARMPACAVSSRHQPYEGWKRDLLRSPLSRDLVAISPMRDGNPTPCSPPDEDAGGAISPMRKEKPCGGAARARPSGRHQPYEGTKHATAAIPV